MNTDYRKFLEEIIKENLFITTDKYLKFGKMGNCLYVKRDFLFRPGRWRGEIELPPHFRLFERNSIVVTGHSDLATDKRDIRRFRSLNRSKIIFGTNMESVENISASLPLGITNDCDDSPIHRILGSTKHFSIAHGLAEFKEDYDASMYVNFTSSNNQDQRSYLLELLRNRRNTIIQSPEMSDRGRISYLKNLKANCLVPCPEGNGFDTHRLWETLYMGGVPIVLKNPAIDPLVRDLPVIQLEEWSQILDEDFLHFEWQRIHSKEMNLNKLSITFWLSFIKNTGSAISGRLT